MSNPLQICYETLYLPFFRDNFSHDEICDLRSRLNLPTHSSHVDIVVDGMIKAAHLLVLTQPREKIIDKMQETLKRCINHNYIEHYIKTNFSKRETFASELSSELETRLDKAIIEIALLKQTHKDDDNEINHLKQIIVYANNEIARLERELEITRSYHQKEIERIKSSFDSGISSKKEDTIEMNPDFIAKYNKYKQFFRDFTHPQLYDIVAKLNLRTMSHDPEVVMKEMYKQNSKSLTYDFLCSLVKNMNCSGLIYNLPKN